MCNVVIKYFVKIEIKSLKFFNKREYIVFCCCCYPGIFFLEFVVCCIQKIYKRPSFQSCAVQIFIVIPIYYFFHRNLSRPRFNVICIIPKYKNWQHMVQNKKTKRKSRYMYTVSVTCQLIIRSTGR